MPAGVVDDEHDRAVDAGLGLAREGLEQRRKERLRDAVVHIPEGFAARRRDEGGHVKPLEAMMAVRDRALANRRPDAARDRLQAEPMLVAGEDLDRSLWMFRRFLGDSRFEAFLKSAASSAVADLGSFGRGAWIDQPIAFKASQPRWTATFSTPSSRARKAATLALVHTPPSSGASFKRARSRSRMSG